MRRRQHEHAPLAGSPANAARRSMYTPGGDVRPLEERIRAAPDDEIEGRLAGEVETAADPRRPAHERWRHREIARTCREELARRRRDRAEEQRRLARPSGTSPTRCSSSSSPSSASGQHGRTPRRAGATTSTSSAEPPRAAPSEQRRAELAESITPELSECLALIARLADLRDGPQHHAWLMRASACKYCRAQPGEACTRRPSGAPYTEVRFRHERRGEERFHAPRMDAFCSGYNRACVVAWRDDLLRYRVPVATVLAEIRRTRLFQLAERDGLLAPIGGAPILWVPWGLGPEVRA